MLSEKKFYAFFPEAKLIKDDALRQKSFEAFADAAEMGGWTEDTIERCPSAVAEFVDSPATQIRHWRHAHSETCVSMFSRFFSGLHLHKTYMRSSVIVELCQGWLISKAIDGIRKS